MSETPQHYWLSRLADANAFNDWIFSEIAPHLGHHVVEIGCGNGSFTCRLAARSQSVFAVDVDPTFVAETRRRTAGLAHVRVQQGDAVRFDWPHTFDCAVMLDVLEHIHDDVGMLSSLVGAVSPGGRLVIKVPAMPFIFNNLDRAVGHFRRYSRAGLRTVVNAAGFHTERMWGFNLLGAAGWWVNGSLLRRSVPPSEHISGFNKLVPILRRLESAVRPPIGASLILVARAPGTPGVAESSRHTG